MEINFSQIFHSDMLIYSFLVAEAKNLIESSLSLVLEQSLANSLGTSYKKIWTLNIYHYFHCYHSGHNQHHLSTEFLLLANWPLFFHYCAFVLNSLHINHSYIFKIQIINIFFCWKLSNYPYLTLCKNQSITNVYYPFPHLQFSFTKHCCKRTDFWILSCLIRHTLASEHVHWLIPLPDTLYSLNQQYLFSHVILIFTQTSLTVTALSALFKIGTQL